MPVPILSPYLLPILLLLGSNVFMTTALVLASAFQGSAPPAGARRCGNLGNSGRPN